MSKKLTIEYIKEQIESVDGYKLLITEYINAKTKLSIQCDKGHIFEIQWNKFQQGGKCTICAGNKKLSYEYVKKYIEDEGYVLLSKTYINAQSYLITKCPNGHNYKVRFYNFKQGYRCSECYGNKLLTYEYVKEQIEKNGYALLSTEYKNCMTKMSLKCPNRHEFEMRYDNFNQGQRCPVCAIENLTSKSEREIQEYLKSFNENIITNDRKTLNGLELDILYKNKAIEYNGDYWHCNPLIYESDYFHKHKHIYAKDIWKRDKYKLEECKRLGIDLLVIWENDYINNKDITLNNIKEFIQG